MKNRLCFLILLAVLVTANGCANGPLKRFFRGAPCNTCNPPMGGAFGQGWGGPATNCENGVCSTPPANMPPQSTIPQAAAKPPLGPYSYPEAGNVPPPDGVLSGLTPIDTPSSSPWQNRNGAVGTGAAFNDYVNPPTPGNLPGPAGSR